MAEIEKGVNFRKNNLKAVKGDKDFASLHLGRIQPQAIPLEEAVLGALMLDKDAFSIISSMLTAESFYLPAHQIIFDAILRLFNKSMPIDLLTVNEEIHKMEALEQIGGTIYLVDLTNKVGSAANVEYHAKIVAQKYIQRQLIQASTMTINDSFEDTKDVFDILDEAEQGLFQITEKNLGREYQSIGALSVKARKMLEDLAAKETGLTGIPSGFDNLDRITSGWQKSDLIILAARPGMGKTAFTLSLARNAAMGFDKKYPVAIFSLEMSNVQLAQRLISMEAGINSQKLRNGQLTKEEWERFHNAIVKMAETPIYIDDTPAINIFELRAKCRRLKQHHGVELIIVDYLQLMTAGSDNKKNGTREQEISSISRALKGLAKELEVPVIALAQLSRAVEGRKNNIPMLSDLRESGSIEQDADIVSFIYRPGYYLEMNSEEYREVQDKAEIIIAKHRNGALDTVELKFVSDYARFENPNDSDFMGRSLESLLSADRGLGDDYITRPSRMNDEDVPY